MSEKISLNKRQEVLKVSLAKAKIPERLVLRVASALDISGSMQELYRNGTVSEFVGKLLPFGLMFDDNAQIDMWAFNHAVRGLPPAVEAVYGDYVGNCMSGISISGGTAYAPVMQDIYNTYFGKMRKENKIIATEERPVPGFFNKLLGRKETVEVETIHTTYEDPEDTTPGMVFFQTDGDNYDDQEVRRLLNQHRNIPVYWFMVGVGNSGFRSLKALAKDFPNVDFISVDDLALTDADLYDKLLSKDFGEWVKKMEVVNA